MTAKWMVLYFIFFVVVVMMWYVILFHYFNFVLRYLALSFFLGKVLIVVYWYKLITASFVCVVVVLVHLIRSRILILFASSLTVYSPLMRSTACAYNKLRNGIVDLLQASLVIWVTKDEDASPQKKVRIMTIACTGRFTN